MSHPQEPDRVKLISSIFSPERDIIDQAIGDLEKPFGAVESLSPECFFDRTRYYAREMGWPLHRRFISFGRLSPPDHLVETKLKTIEIEGKYLRNGKRLVNIDPGFISPERLVLATGKNYVHRIYLSRGIYADLTLTFKRGSFRPLKWTYPDYADEEVISLFNEIRNQYMAHIRRTKNFD